MTYFSNGQEGDAFEEAFCDNCAHRPGSYYDERGDGKDCPIMFLHALWNYDQLAADRESLIKNQALSILIPRPADTGEMPTCQFYTKQEPPAGN